MLVGEIPVAQSGWRLDQQAGFEGFMMRVGGGGLWQPGPLKRPVPKGGEATIPNEGCQLPIGLHAGLRVKAEETYFKVFWAQCEPGLITCLTASPLPIPPFVILRAGCPQCFKSAFVHLYIIHPSHDQK